MNSYIIQSFVVRLAKASVVAMLLAGLGQFELSTSQAQDSPPNQVRLKTEKIIVFKDGYTLVIKRGTATTDEDGEIFTSQVPDAAVLGSFWAVPVEGTMRFMNAGWETAESKEVREIPCTQVLDILEANQGKQCDLELEDKSVLSGEILRVLTQPTEVGVPTTWHADLGLSSIEEDPDGLQNGAMLSHVMTSRQGTHFMLRHENGDQLLAISDVKKLTVRDMETTIKRTVTSTRREKRLTFGFDEANVEREIVVMYFRPGVRWIPTYRLELGKADGDGNAMAKMSLQAELLNEAENFSEAEVDIVVGVPNFRFSGMPSPLSLERTLRNSLAQAAPLLSNQFGNNAMSNSLMSQQAPQVHIDNSFGGDSGSIQLPDELTSVASQDLYIYHLPKISLEKGDRAAVPILSADVEYRDVFTWDIQLQQDDVAVFDSRVAQQSPLQLSTNKIWRQIELANRTEMPWTTGAAMIMEGQQPLAQELLTYTSSGANCRVPVTVAVDLRGSVTESEIERKVNALNWSDHSYTRISQRASLRLVNRKSEAVDVEISLRLGGRVDSASDEGNVDINAFRAADWKRYRSDPSVNNSSTVSWTLKLEPGQTFEPTIDYHYYARQ